MFIDSRWLKYIDATLMNIVLIIWNIIQENYISSEEKAQIIKCWQNECLTYLLIVNMKALQWS